MSEIHGIITLCHVMIPLPYFMPLLLYDVITLHYDIMMD